MVIFYVCLFFLFSGMFGSGVLSYFVLLRWLFFLNIVILLSTVFFLFIPQIIHDQSSEHNSASFTGWELLTGEVKQLWNLLTQQQLLFKLTCSCYVKRLSQVLFCDNAWLFQGHLTKIVDQFVYVHYMLCFNFGPWFLRDGSRQRSYTMVPTQMQQWRRLMALSITCP